MLGRNRDNIEDAMEKMQKALDRAAASVIPHEVDQQKVKKIAKQCAQSVLCLALLGIWPLQSGFTLIDCHTGRRLQTSHACRTKRQNLNAKATGAAELILIDGLAASNLQYYIRHPDTLRRPFKLCQ